MNIDTLKTHALPALLAKGITPVLVGHRGNGKTEAVRQYANENGYKLFEYRLGQATDGGDLTGLADIQRDVQGNPVSTKFAIPTFLKEIEGEEKVILFLDEWNRASKDMIQYVFELIYEKRLSINGFKLPKEGHVILAMNPPTKEYNLHNFQDTAFYDRLCQLKIETDLNDWVKYAQKTGVDRDVIEFLQTQPSMANANLSSFQVKAEPSWRSWLRFASVKESLKNKPDVLADVACGMVGMEGAVAFSSFMKDRKSILIEDVILDFKKFEKELLTYKVSDENNRQDILANLKDQLMLVFSTRETAKQKFTDKEMVNIVAFIKCLPADLSNCIIKEFGMYPYMITPPDDVVIAEDQYDDRYLVTNRELSKLVLDASGFDSSKLDELISKI